MFDAIRFVLWFTRPLFGLRRVLKCGLQIYVGTIHDSLHFPSLPGNKMH